MIFAQNYPDYVLRLGFGSGPLPYPDIVQDFQSVIGREARTQF